MQSHQLGSLISWHRKRAGLTQRELSLHAGVSRYVIQEIESGSGRTIWSNIEPVLAILNLQLEPKGPLVNEWKATRDARTTVS